MTEQVELEPGTRKEIDQRLQTVKTRNPQKLSPENAKLVNRIIQTLAALEEAGDPLRSSPIGAQMRVRRANSEKDEGRNTRWARGLQYRIRSSVVPLLNEYDQRKDETYTPPPRRDKVRCMNRKCDNYGKRIPKHVGRHSEIELVRCPTCTHKLVGETESE